MTTPTVNWRLRDQILAEKAEREAAMESTDTISMSRATRNNLGIQMNMKGDIVTLFGMSVELDSELEENEFVIE